MVLVVSATLVVALVVVEPIVVLVATASVAEEDMTLMELVDGGGEEEVSGEMGDVTNGTSADIIAELVVGGTLVAVTVVRVVVVVVNIGIVGVVVVVVPAAFRVRSGVSTQSLVSVTTSSCKYKRMRLIGMELGSGLGNSRRISWTRFQL